MPHYADGTVAKVGDNVTGKFINTDGVRAGTIVSITPGSESCNAQIQFTEVRPVGGVLGGDPGGLPTMPAPPQMALRDGFVRAVKGEQHGTSGPTFIIFTCVDYCDTNKLTKVGP